MYVARAGALSKKHKLPPQLLPNSGMGKDWGLEEISNPAIAWLEFPDSESRPRFVNQHIVGYVVGDFDDDVHLAVSEFQLPAFQRDVAVIQIDLRKSVDGQFEKLLPILEARRQHFIADNLVEPLPRTGANMGSYTDLLRIFDAYRAKESEENLNNSEIANRIYGVGKGSAEAIARRYAVAARYVNKKDYLRLLL